jgi:predicted AlkP superfamily phosphohydrolase/phosphomutase
MDKYPWDFFMVHYLETDQVQHSYWRVLNTNSPNANAILELYQLVDRSLGQIVDRLPPDATMIVMSDHGMGPTEYHVHLNNWLLREGFMHWRSQLSTNLRRFLYTLGLSPTSIYNHLPSGLIRRVSFGEVRTGLIQFDPLRKPQRLSLMARLRESLVRAPVINFDDIDWNRTLAYSAGTTGAGLIYINVHGREPNGIVKPGAEYESVRDAIAQKLVGLIDPFSGQPLVREVLKREQVYEGEQVVNAPDLLVLYRGGEYDSKKGTVFLSKNVVDRVKDGNATHRLMGLIALSGAGIASGGRLPDASILDVAPTIMRLLDMPVPSDFEGQVILAALDESQRQVIHHPIVDSQLPAVAEAQPDMSPEELQAVLDKLKVLGYIE